MHKMLTAGAAALVAISAMLISTGALAYQTPSPTNSTGSVSPVSAGAGGTVTFTATFKDANGGAVAGASVTFSQQSGPAGCSVTFSPTSGTTDANGQVSTTVTLPAGCSGNFVLAAATAGATVTATVGETGGFPATSADPPASGSPLPVLALALGLALMTLGGAALVLRRR